GVPTLITLLSFEETEILCHVCTIFVYIASFLKRDAIAYVLLPLVTLCSHADPKPIKNIFASGSDHIFPAERRVGSLEWLSKFSFTIAAALDHLLGGPDAAVIRRACSALSIIARHHPFNEHLLSSEVGPALIALSSHRQIADAVMDALFQNSEPQETVGQKLRKQVALLLCKLLSSTDTSLLHDACLVLAQLAKYCGITPDRRQTVDSCKGLVSLLSDGEYANTDARWPHSVVPILVTLLDACTTFAHIAFFLNPNTIAEVLLPIVSLCSHAKPVVRTAAVFAFSEIIQPTKPPNITRWGRIASLEWLCGFLFSITNQCLRLRGEPLLERIVVNDFLDTGSLEIVFPILVDLAQSGNRPQVHLACVVLARMCLDIRRRLHFTNREVLNMITLASNL
ncbi:armadillo-type protein, partial [Mycena leptocephala]